MATTWLPIIVLAPLALLLVWAVSTYNNLVLLRTNNDKAFANIDVLLRQRHDELPNLVETCRAAMEHERTTLENLTRLRSRYRDQHAVPRKAMLENEIVRTLDHVFALAENYPDLKTNENMLALQNRITGLEGQIADRREFYNDSVSIYNTSIGQFPTLIVARLFRFVAYPFLEIPEELRATPKVETAG